MQFQPDIDSVTNSKITVDFEIFQQISTKCDVGYAAESIISNCPYLQRFSTALKYYELLCDNTKYNQTEVTQQMVVEFCAEKYTQLLDDYIHFVKAHSSNEQLLQIEQELKNKFHLPKCHISECKRLHRHYRGNTDENKNSHSDNDHQFEFYANCFDRFHHQVFHLFEMGLRIESNKIPESKQNNGQDSDFLIVDKIFSKTRDLIKKRREICGLHLQRYNDKNNKYNLCIEESISEPFLMNKMNANTFLDEMYSFIERSEKMEETQIMQLTQYLASDEYDSDATQDDVTGLISTSNIYINVNNVSCYDLIKSYIRTVELSSASFSTGYKFFYWKRCAQDTSKQFGKILNGYSPSELFILPHFQSLKEEVVFCGYVSLQHWNEKIVFKANEFCATKKVKDQKGDNYKENYYGTSDSILISHLYCLILYCDFSELSTIFSSTFRKEHIFETLKLLKKRHSQFYYFAKGLVEIVNRFGSTNRIEHGPFYCGLNKVMNIASFSIYLKSPCSTTKTKEIAINFATRSGIIISFQNDIRREGARQKFFDCSWISQYTEENERLFISGYKMLRIESIIIIETANNYSEFVHSFHVFDQMISGVKVYPYDKRFDICSSDVAILDSLINNKLEVNQDGNRRITDQYVVDTFDLFLYNKTQIKIYLEDLDQYYQKINHLLMHPLHDEDLWRNNEERVIDFESDVDMINVLKANTLNIFPNLNEIEINTTYGSFIDYYGNPQFRFSLLSFLSSIQSSKSSIKYIIKAKRNHENSWINNIVTSSIEKAFNDKGWKIIQSNLNTDDILKISQ